MKTMEREGRTVGAVAALVAAGLLAPGPALADPAPRLASTVTPVMTRALPELPGKEMSMITVTMPPGSSDGIHRHDAHVMVYMLEGSVVMQVRGGPAQTLKVGQGYYEAPEDVHLVGRNASRTKPAKFLVVFVKDVGKAPVLPAQ